MGMKPRRKPVRREHRRQFVLTEYWPAQDRFIATDWSDHIHDLMAACEGPSWPNVSEVVMSRGQFEEREQEDRGFDAAAPRDVDPPF